MRRPIQRRRESGGSLSPRPIELPDNKKLDDNDLEQLRRLIAKTPDMTLEELAAALTTKVSEIESAGARVLRLPPYSPDYNPIEMAISKIKSLLRKLARRSIDDLDHALGASHAGSLPALRGIGSGTGRWGGEASAAGDGTAGAGGDSDPAPVDRVSVPPRMINEMAHGERAVRPTRRCAARVEHPVGDHLPSSQFRPHFTSTRTGTRRAMAVAISWRTISASSCTDDSGVSNTSSS